MPSKKWIEANPQLALVRNRTKRRIVEMLGRAHAPPLTLLGCSYKELSTHLGEIRNGDVIDHIIPLRWYNFADPVDIMRAFNWRNTQRLTHAENTLKGASLPNNDLLLRARLVWPHAWWPATDALDGHFLGYLQSVP